MRKILTLVAAWTAVWSAGAVSSASVDVETYAPSAEPRAVLMACAPSADARGFAYLDAGRATFTDERPDPALNVKPTPRQRARICNLYAPYADRQRAKARFAKRRAKTAALRSGDGPFAGRIHSAPPPGSARRRTRASAASQSPV